LSQGYSIGLSPNFKRDAYLCSGATRISKDTKTFMFSPRVEGTGCAYLFGKKKKAKPTLGEGWAQNQSPFGRNL